MLERIMSEEKPNQREVLKILMEKVRRFAPKASNTQLEDFVIKACEHYRRYLNKNRDRGEVKMMTDKAYEMFSDYEDVVTVDDVMKMLHIGKNSVYDLLKNHRIESIKVGSRYVIPKKSVINFLNI